MPNKKRPPRRKIIPLKVAFCFSDTAESLFGVAWVLTGSPIDQLGSRGVKPLVHIGRRDPSIPNPDYQLALPIIRETSDFFNEPIRKFHKIE